METVSNTIFQLILYEMILVCVCVLCVCVCVCVCMHVYYSMVTIIYTTITEFKGYIGISCTERCTITYHSLCWRKLREENVNLQTSDKVLLVEPVKCWTLENEDTCSAKNSNWPLAIFQPISTFGRPKSILIGRTFSITYHLQKVADQFLTLIFTTVPYNPDN